ncbi:hypothetical protein B0T25DRAFT_46812 [Lasiosphaeria hispida]|uniref:non-specific serine/threonine protein kinase n=1 Tax=Lasiosphaeria hispida TaxID=260671 RepID=A0AAJ0HVP2_9PEZI|nr:hypothetical protein B0T25DRAFT_46812 [Lasiosphaeria hispida]
MDQDLPKGSYRIPIIRQPVGDRQPLGDVTRGGGNATMAAVGHRSRIDTDNSAVPKPKAANRGHSNPVISNYHSSEHDGGRMVSRRLSANTHESRTANDPRRVSQLSNHSASGKRRTENFIGPWELGKTLGKGSSARVRLGRHRVTAHLVAIKIVGKATAHLTQSGSLAKLHQVDSRKPMTSTDGVRRMPLAIEREVAILRLLQHPNIIQLMDIWENKSDIYIITDYVEKGDMFNFINNIGCLREEEAIYYFRQMMSALEYCHSLNICHRDLKPENILLKADGQVKIADFGMAALQQTPTHQLRTACGSPHYAAPELLRQQYYKGSAVDIWSLGVILFAMLAGHLPFDDPDQSIMLAKAKRAQYKMPRGLSPEAEDLIRKILVHQPSMRITMREMWKHPLIVKYNDLDKLHLRDDHVQNVLRNADIAPIPEWEVDLQIFRQLSSLWHSFSEGMLKAKLAEERPNDQKLFYWLLFDHRETRLENYSNNVPISKGDFHHLKPPNWAKRVATCEFTQPGPSSANKAASKFTIVSGAPEADDAGTVRSYDPYNASVLQPCERQASHAKITVHRNDAEPGVAAAPSVVSQSHQSYKSVGGSYREKRRAHSQRVATIGQLKLAGGSTMSSIRSHRSGSHTRAPLRTKRGVDFSSIRNNKSRPSYRSRELYAHSKEFQEAGVPISFVDESTTCGDDILSLFSLCRPKATVGTQLGVDDGVPREDSEIWNDELQKLGTLIAEDCDKAFQSSIVFSESVGRRESREASPFSVESLSLSLGTSGRLVEIPNLETRPLPPTPPESITPVSTPGWKHGTNVVPLPLNLNHPKYNNSTDRRTVSEPFSTGGREVRPLPSIYENMSEERKRGKNHYHNMFDLDSPVTPTPAADNEGLPHHARAEHTIRVVNSPAPEDVPLPLNVRKVSRNKKSPPNVPTAAAESTQDSRALRSAVYEAHKLSGLDLIDGHTGEVTLIAAATGSAQPKMRVTSWFKRANTKEEGGASSAHSNSAGNDVGAEGSGIHDASHHSESQGSKGTQALAAAAAAAAGGAELRKKKSFRLSFWKSSTKSDKSEPRMSIAEDDPEDMVTPVTPSLKTSFTPNDQTLDQKVAADKDEEARLIKKREEFHARIVAKIKMWRDHMNEMDPEPESDGFGKGDGTGRVIDVQQHWLAKLFHVKPATRALCFTMSKKRARQELAALLREWRKWGIRDVQVNKEMSFVFARVAAKNALGLKEVWFAVEVMRVIEHGKRQPLSIMRFTQERGAASTMYRVVEEVEKEFRGRCLTVRDKRKVAMMLKTMSCLEKCK